MRGLGTAGDDIRQLTSDAIWKLRYEWRPWADGVLGRAGHTRYCSMSAIGMTTPMKEALEPTATMRVATGLVVFHSAHLTVYH